MAAIEHRKSPWVSELNVPSRNPMASNAKLEHRPYALHRWWCHSTVRKLLKEIRSFPHRMLAIRQLPKWGLFRLPPAPEGLPQIDFLQSCNDCIQQLCKEQSWASYLDAQILAESYARGARWAIDNYRTEIRRQS